MTPEPLAPSRGLNVLHLFCHPGADVDAGALRKAVDDARADGLQVVNVAIMGAKADVCFMILGEDLWTLRQLQSKIQAAGFLVAESYVSVTEVSEYAAGDNTAHSGESSRAASSRWSPVQRDSMTGIGASRSSACTSMTSRSASTPCATTKPRRSTPSSARSTRDSWARSTKFSTPRWPRTRC